ncbi:right-handed parallel beta-helix repeat-containing protein [Chryseobacterium polytrichastri]|uniref:Parallel beta-helix repeat (Two copies) n=1 Tax=Chryseobacterium polytrichastri TaxID=1302687 RepID=A0A1M6RV22_9FLAO|nr:right-handed parallel beta-helix repeat-containing protein [Chryseobacterium polytrichastri]SHK36323.1 parallel beta-helix repeat (two copies) [Chryseobacterium polytrichastri]
MITKHIQDPKTGEMISLIPVTHWYKGTLMEDSFCDEIIYFKGKPEDSDRYYKRYIEDHINVKWFGAMGDGSDATANIQQAFNYLIDLRNYRHISKPSYDLCCFIPDGKYKIEKTLLFPTSCVLKGESKHGTVLFTERNDISLLFPSEKGNSSNNHHTPDDPEAPYVNTGEEFTIISNLTIAGIHYKVSPTAWRPEILNNFNNGILIYKTIKITLQNINIEGFENAAIHINNSFYINIDNSTFHNNKIGILTDGTTTSTHVINSTIRLNAKGISLYDTYGCSFINCIIEANVANYSSKINGSETAKAIGVYLKNSNNISFTNSYFEAHLDSVILDSSNSNTFTNCFFAPFENADFGTSTKVVRFSGSSSYNKFINNYYEAFKPLIYSPYKFSVENKSLSKGNLFEFTLKDHLDNFISLNQTEFNEFQNLGLAENAPKFICEGSNERYSNVERRYITDKTFGSSSERPVNNLYGGQHYFDSTLGKPIYWQGTKWVKPDGTDA